MPGVPPHSPGSAVRVWPYWGEPGVTLVKLTVSLVLRVSKLGLREKRKKTVGFRLKAESSASMALM